MALLTCDCSAVCRALGRLGIRHKAVYIAYFLVLYFLSEGRVKHLCTYYIRLPLGTTNSIYSYKMSYLSKLRDNGALLKS